MGFGEKPGAYGLLLLVVGIGLLPVRAYAISAGTSCQAATDISAVEDIINHVDDTAIQFLSNAGTCRVQDNFGIDLLDRAGANEPFWIILNSNFGQAPEVVNTFTVLYHASVTNVQRDGGAFASGTNVLVQTADNFSTTFTIT